MTFPQWLEIEHEYNGSTTYEIGGLMVYSVLELDEKAVHYKLVLDGVYHYSREFHSEGEAQKFYVSAAKKMKKADERGMVPLWDHLQ